MGQEFCFHFKDDKERASLHSHYFLQTVWCQGCGFGSEEADRPQFRFGELVAEPGGCDVVCVLCELNRASCCKQEPYLGYLGFK